MREGKEDTTQGRVEKLRRQEIREEADSDEQEAGNEAPEMRGDDELDGGSEERVTCALCVGKWPLICLEKGKNRNKPETSISIVNVSAKQRRWAWRC